MTEETKIKKQIKDYLNLKRVFWWWNVQGLGSFRGLPDLMAVKDGKIYGIEVKTEKGKLSENQKEFLGTFEARGGVPVVARKLEDVIDKGL